MFKTLRNRLILSHILPFLIIIPLLGIALIYILETYVYLPTLSQELENNARLLAALTADYPEVWQDPLKAQVFLARADPVQNARVMLLRVDGVVLASNDANDAYLIGNTLDLTGLEDVIQGQIINIIHYSQRYNGDVIDVFVPVISPASTVWGMVRMTYRFESISSELFRLRYLIGGATLLSTIIGSILGYFLAISIEAPIGAVTQAVDGLARGSRTQLLEVYGPNETRKLAESVNFLVTRLREFEDSRRKLLANLVHELGRPLGALRSAIQALAHGAEKDPVFYEELVTGMDGEAERLQHLLEDLAHLHDQVLGALELDLQLVDISTWLPPVLPTWQETARDKGLTWTEEIPQGLAPVEGDPVRLAQVVGNLISNAIKFTSTGGSVTISARQENHQIGITIADTGIGMTEDEQEKIFNPFYRGTLNRRFPQGMGLGLSIATDLVQAHGGHIDVTSHPGEGSQFTVWLPCKE